VSRKHYERIAKALEKVTDNNCGCKPTDFLDLIDELCVIFEEDNDRFDSDRFKEACGIIEVYNG
jgi:hypothetical protein